MFDSLCSGVMISGSLVTSETGKFVDTEGTSNGISSATDRAWLGALRRNSQVVLTSGKTFRAESYRMPKTADLAVLSNAGVSTHDLVIPEGRNLHLLGPMESFTAGVHKLRQLGYGRIHLEFGPTGMREVLGSNLRPSVFLSGPSRQSLELAADNLGARLQYLCLVEGLHLGLVR